MTTCHRLTHRHKAFTLDTYEHNQRWRYGVPFDPVLEGLVEADDEEER